MLALVKTDAGPGLELRDVPEPGDRHQRRPDPRPQDRHLRHGPAHRVVGSRGRRQTIKPPLVVGHEFVGEIVEVGSNVADFQPGDLVSGEGHVVCGRCRHCLAGRRHLCANTIGLGVGRDGAFAEYVVLPMTNVWHHWPGIDEEVAAIFDPFGNAVHTALAFPVLGEDVLVIGRRADRADGDRRRPPRRRAPRRRQRAERRSAASSRCGWARRSPSTRASATSRDVQRELGMVEGFDVALEMSGNPAALRDAIGAMAHGGGIAILGIPTEEIALDVNEIVFKMLTLRGIYGREMYETWYKMTVMLQSGLDITPGDHPPLRVPRATRRPSRRPAPATPARSSWTGRMSD